MADQEALIFGRPLQPGIVVDRHQVSERILAELRLQTMLLVQILGAIDPLMAASRVEVEEMFREEDDPDG